jgi:FkbH-like protein
VGDGRRGLAFTRFQQAVKQLTAQGVLLAAVSKNDLEPVRKVLAEHPGMTLRENDFVQVVANWRPKHDNLRELAATLNIGLDSVVFADDSAFECGLVRRELPEVAVVRLDDEPALHTTRLLADGWFDVPSVTADDRERPARYREEAARKEFLDGFDTLHAYLRELDLRVRLEHAADADMARVAQLTVRTNQFNLTVDRLSEGDVRRRARDVGTPVVTVRSADRFGDNGLVGTLLLRWADRTLWIDNFLLSCRVFGRGIEQACLATVLRYAADRGAAEVRGRYRPSAKNGKVADLYPRHGFVETAPESGEFRHDLTDVPAPPDHIRLSIEL